VIELRVNETASAKLRGLIAAFGVGAGGKVLVAVRDAMRTQNQYVIGWLGQYNRGKGPYSVDQHRLGHVSKNWRVRMNSKESIQGTQVRAAIVNEMEYAAAHEFGAKQSRVTKPGVARLRLDRFGQLLRQSDNYGDNRAVFASKKHKNVYEKAYAGGKSYTVNIPARGPITHGIEKHIPKYETALSNAIIKSVDATWRGIR
jgi:phage gpG-like protein